MIIKLNWNYLKKLLIKKVRSAILLILLFSTAWYNAIAQGDTVVVQIDSLNIEENDLVDDGYTAINTLDTIVAKTNKIIIEEDTLPAYSISVGKVGATFPCGSRFGISLQAPGYHIFSAESAYNATFVPDSEEIKWPDDGGNKNGKTYQNTFERIKKMRVGTINGNFGKRWTISSEQFKDNYDNLFDFELDGQKKSAGDYSNLFFEMLISIQELAKENDELKTRLEDTEGRLAVIEEKLDLVDTKNTVRSLKSQIKISPNPSDNGALNIQYSIVNKVNNATLHIFDLNGRSIYKTPITQRGVGDITKLFNLSSGVYFYQLFTDGVKSETEKLIIN